MVRWAEFERSAPVLAESAGELLRRHGFMLLGTVRRDGTARISPVGVRITGDELTMSFLAASTKERDVRRDGRILLHGPVLHGGDPNSELKLRGLAVEVEDEALREEAALWDPPPALVVFRLDIESAALLAWSKGEVQIQRWSSSRGLY